jgi:prolyl oligopeptidase
MYSFRGSLNLSRLALNIIATLATALTLSSVIHADAPEDPYVWLENVDSEKSLDWVKNRNAITIKELQASENFKEIENEILKIMDSKEKIPDVVKHGKWYYNFWRDENNVRGLWRRTTLEEYKKPNPAWVTVLDLDQLASTEKENWVWKGYEVLHPTFDRCMISLSRGGADASVVREFDLQTQQFVADGFHLPEAKSKTTWLDRDTLYVGTNFGPGSLTKSGYPRIIKKWKRGTPLSAATVVFEGKLEDVSVDTVVSHDHGITYEFIERAVTFFTNEQLVRRGDQWVKIDKPEDATVSTYADQILISLRTDWTIGGKTYPGGSLLAGDFEAYLKGERNLESLFVPTDRKSLIQTVATKNFLILNELENVRSRLYLLKRENGKWTRTSIETPAFGSVEVSEIDSNESDDYFMESSDFLSPTTLYIGTAGQNRREKLKSLPAFFDANELEISQHEAVSKDGTRIPYFQVGRKNLKLDGSNPTLLYGYGGFEIPMIPQYSPGIGPAWLSRGGVYVLANIRGGGEFGPKWHEVARKKNRQRAYDDFIAVAQDLSKRQVTSPQHLGIKGGSNGGLLMGVMLTQAPQLFKAVVCQVPLLDMKRYHLLLAGASWVAEYGDPSKPDEWAYISKYSPYQNVFEDREYPRTLFTTSTRDDRVHPGHARKMAARMIEQKHDILYYENIEGGHGGAANNKQSAFKNALEYSFLLKELK